MLKHRPFNEQAKTIDGMTNFNCGFKLQNVTYADTVMQYEIWPDNLAQQ